MADIGLCVGVEFSLELLFITIHISVHLGAELHLEGPPFGGWVYVDFWVFGFTIPFGDDNAAGEPLALERFCELLTNIPDPDNTAAADAPTVNKLHVLSVEAGRFAESQNKNDTKQGAIWEVKRGGFVFRVQSRIPVQAFVEPVYVERSTAKLKNESSFYAKPMHLTEQLGSFMQVWVQKTEEHLAPVDKDFQISAPVFKQMPLTLWGICKSFVGLLQLLLIDTDIEPKMIQPAVPAEAIITLMTSWIPRAGPRLS